MTSKTETTSDLVMKVIGVVCLMILLFVLLGIVFTWSFNTFFMPVFMPTTPPISFGAGIGLFLFFWLLTTGLRGGKIGK